jgi:hypothetical protein
MKSSTNKALKRLKKWRDGLTGTIVLFIVCAAIAFGLINLAINDGSLWIYLLTLIFLVQTLKNLLLIPKRISHGRKRATTR